MSNYTATLTPAALRAWQLSFDVGLVIVQAVSPPPGYPAGVTRAQIAACVKAGMPVDCYLYLWTNGDVAADMQNKLSLLNGLEQHVGRLWLDIEDVSAATPAARIKAIRQALAVLDTWSAEHGKPTPGCYSGRWWWTAYAGNTTEFSGRALWTSQYDHVEDARVFQPYGGWASCILKQYVGTSTLAGVTGVDLNVIA